MRCARAARPRARLRGQGGAAWMGPSASGCCLFLLFQGCSFHWLCTIDLSMRVVMVGAVLLDHVSCEHGWDSTAYNPLQRQVEMVIGVMSAVLLPFSPHNQPPPHVHVIPTGTARRVPPWAVSTTRPSCAASRECAAGCAAWLHRLAAPCTAGCGRTVLVLPRVGHTCSLPHLLSSLAGLSNSAPPLSPMHQGRCPSRCHATDILYDARGTQLFTCNSA